MYRYIGNKTKVLSSLIPIITDGLAPGDRVADLMCGTASVSAACRAAGFKVTASDILTFATFHAQTRLLGSPPTFDSLGLSYQGLLDELNNLEPEAGYFTNEYSEVGTPRSGDPARKYLTHANAARLDTISSRLTGLHTTGMLHAVETAVLRHNLVLAVNRVANIAGTYGHFQSTFSRSSMQRLELRPTTFASTNPLGHEVHQGRAEDLASTISADLVYIDPPYMKRQYAANYHLLETVALGDEAPAVGKSGLRDWWPQYSDFCSKRKIHGAFREVLTKSPASRFMISYSEDGLLSEAQMYEMLAEYGSVRVHRFKHTRFRSNASKLTGELEELVFEVDRR